MGCNTALIFCAGDANMARRNVKQLAHQVGGLNRVDVLFHHDEFHVLGPFLLLAFIDPEGYWILICLLVLLFEKKISRDFLIVLD